MLKESKMHLYREDILLRNAAFTFMIGFLLYHLFPVPPIFWRMGLVIMSLIGLYLHIQHYRFTLVERSIFCFLSVNIIYFFVSFLWQIPESTNFGNVLCAILPMFLFFFLSARGAVTDRSLQVFLFIAAIAAVVYFFHAESLTIRDSGEESGYLTNNASSVFLVFIPLLFFVKNRFLLLVFMAEIVYFILYGAKRGNIVAGTIPLLLLLSKQFRFKGSLFSKILMIVGVFVLSAFAYNMASNNEYLTKRFDKTLEGDTSNRDIIYAKAWCTWADAESAKNMFFGYGTDGTTNEIGDRAHNDWLEILVDFGVLGGLFYFLFFVCLLQTILSLRRKNKHAAYILFSVLIIWFLKSLFSMGVTENLFSYLSMVIGVVLGRTYGAQCKIARHEHHADGLNPA